MKGLRPKNKDEVEVLPKVVSFGKEWVIKVNADIYIVEIFAQCLRKVETTLSVLEGHTLGEIESIQNYLEGHTQAEIDVR